MTITPRRTQLGPPVAGEPVTPLSAFDLPGFSLEVVRELTLAFEQGEGLTFQNSREGIVEQTSFLVRLLRAVGPRHVLETGTHKAHFSYLLKLAVPEARIDTFGLDPESQRCVDLLNRRFGQFVTFHPGDSKTTLDALDPSCPVDFAWIDGGHDVDTCTQDLENCARLCVPHVCVDDVRGERQVQLAVWAFLARRVEYEEEAFSADPRGIAYLRRRGRAR